MKKIYMDEPIDVDLFIKIWKEELQNMPLNEFSKNMKNSKYSYQTYSDWIKTWLAWNELSSEDDIDMMYGRDHNSYIEVDEIIED